MSPHGKASTSSATTCAYGSPRVMPRSASASGLSAIAYGSIVSITIRDVQNPSERSRTETCHGGGACGGLCSAALVAATA